MIDVVSDANVALKWFHGDGEEGLDEARALLEAQRRRRIVLFTLDLTGYEVGNALLRGRSSSRPAQVAIVLEALGEVCSPLVPTDEERGLAARLAHRHRLTFYDAAYGAVARGRGAELATFDRELIRAGLGRLPREILAAGLEGGG